MTFKEFIESLQRALNAQGEKLGVDGDPGTKTKAALAKYEIEIKATPIPVIVAPASANPAYTEAKKFEGKQETDKTFGAWLSTFWGKVGLPKYKTIIGTSFAWCGLFIAAMNTQTGQKIVTGAAGAKNWATYGQSIDWKKNGIPRGAVMHLNHKGDCKSEANNHVTFADGACAPSDLTKSGATVPGFGGNQANQVKRSNYAVMEVCEVRWPSEIPLPAPVTKSIDCNAGNLSNESTR